MKHGTWISSLQMTSLICPIVVASTLPAQAPGCPAHDSHIEVASGSFSSQPGVTFQLKHFVATLVPVSKVAPGCLQKITVVSRAEIFVSNESLTRIFAEKLTNGQSKIREFAVHNGVGKVTLSGMITKVIPIHFTIEGPVSTDGELIRVDAQKIKADGVPVKALLGMVGEHLNSIFQMKGVEGVSVEENSLTFSPERVAHLRGRIRSVETTERGLILTYGQAPQRPLPKRNQRD